MTHNRDYYLACAQNMERIGGSFASAIAKAFFVADEHNMTKLLASFGTLFEKFAPQETEQ